MIVKQTKTAGVILAGGLARRMNHQDKGLVLYNGKPLISYAIAAMSPLVDEILLNANRNHAEYSRFGLNVISDQSQTFDGPLAGILAALLQTKAEILLVMPCDSPLIQTAHLQKLLDALSNSTAEIAVAFDGERWQPVFLALKNHLKSSLENYLNAGERKLETWIKRRDFVLADFSAEKDIFINLNTLAEITALENANIATATNK